MPKIIQSKRDINTSKSESVDFLEIPINQSFPEDDANELAAIEIYNKHLYRPNTYLHKWWARRSGTTFRYLLKQLVSDPKKRDYYKAGGLKGKIIFDPMMGGGTTIHEAIRMGANIIGFDIDPIPVLQTKASLSLSPLSQKESIFNNFFKKLSEKLEPFFKTECNSCNKKAEIQFVLYGLRRKCACKEVIFIDQLLIRKDNPNDIYICSKCHDVYIGTEHTCHKEAERPLIVKKIKKCEECHTTFTDIIDEPFSKRYIPLIIVGICPQHGRFFKTVTQEDLDIIKRIDSITEEISFSDLQLFQISKGPKSNDLLKKGINNFQELFYPRQLLYLKTSLDLLSNYSNEDRLWLALLISTSLEFNSILCGYKGSDIRRPGAVRHVFSHHAYTFPYTSLENNPIFSNNTSGTLNRLFLDRIVRAKKWANEPVETKILNSSRKKVSVKGEIDGGESVNELKFLADGKSKFFILQADSSNYDIPEGIVDYVITDPPYYDNVQYSDLSNFFRCWLSLLYPIEVDWNYNTISSAVSEGKNNNNNNNRKFEDLMTKIWKMSFKSLNKENGLLIFTFHHWNYEAWAELTISLKKANFVLVNRFVVLSENPISLHIRDLKAIKHDTIFVLKPNVSKVNNHKWQKPSKLNTTDSYAFCHDCGTALGWFLVSDIEEEEIYNEWKLIFEGDKNGKKSS